MSSRENTPLINRAYVNPYKVAPWYKNKRFYLNLIRRSLAEFLGTALVVFTGVSSFSNIVAAEAAEWAHPPVASAVVVALAFGLAYAGLMAATMSVRCVRVYVCVFVVNKYSILLSIVAFTDSLCKLSVQNNAVTDSN